MNEHKSLREQFANWCRHFNGAHNHHCTIGVVYGDVIEAGTRNLPCLKDDGCSYRCASASFLTEQELDVKVAEEEEIVRKFLAEMAEGKTCVVCHAPIENKYQVGRCVYAAPCNHRQYQGKVEYEKK